jgi:two-component system OmpR family response regulator
MRILVVEDDETLGDAIAKTLQTAGYAVDRVNRAEHAYRALHDEHFELVVLDLGLPDGDGADVLLHLRRQQSEHLVLILTARDSLEDRVAGLNLGADDYLVKPVAMVELVARVRALLRRRISGGNTHLQLGQLELDMAGKRGYHEGTVMEFSAREWSVLEHLVSRVGRIVSKEQLIQSLTGWEQELSLNAIEAYVHRLRAKLEPAGLAIRTVRGLGYVIEDPARAH